MRAELIKNLNIDIICLNETHFLGNKVIDLPGYTWYGHNRSMIHVRANKGSGGVGWLVKNNLYNDFSFDIFDKSYEGIISLSVKHIPSQFAIILIGCYLPPENSVWGRNSTDFFAHLITLLYQSMNSDLVMLCGDLNARIGDKLDSINVIDNVPLRKNVDQETNKHGESLIEFMKDTRMCTLNGRYDADKDDFTSISSRGKSVVDYIITPHECLRFCKAFQVVRCTDAVDEFNLQYLLNDKSKMPDHSILLAKVQVSYMQEIVSNISHNIESNIYENPRFKMYCFENIPDDFMKSKSWIKAVNDIIDCRENLLNSQNQVDYSYDYFCSALKSEMNLFLKYKQGGKVSSKRYKHNKPYWDDDLSDLWKILKHTEHAYTKCKKNGRGKHYLFTAFKSARKNFDRTLRQKERQYFRTQAHKIEQCNTNNPKEFWKYIKNWDHNGNQPFH